ncbi:Bacterial TniB protein [compost metagenome]
MSGEPGAGKTSIVDKIKEYSKNWSFNVRYISLADACNNVQFKEKLVSEIGGANMPGWSARQGVPRELEKFLVMKNVQVLVIDEFHDLMTVQKAERLKNLSLLKSLSGDPFKLCLICFGTPAAVNALSIDEQLHRRFSLMEISDWKEDDEFRSFLAGVEQNLPLKKQSQIYSKEIVRYLLEHSNGKLDAIMGLLRFGAVQAIISGDERITIGSLETGKRMKWLYDLEQSETQR